MQRNQLLSWRGTHTRPWHCCLPYIPHRIRWSRCCKQKSRTWALLICYLCGWKMGNSTLHPMPKLLSSRHKKIDSPHADLQTQGIKAWFCCNCIFGQAYLQKQRKASEMSSFSATVSLLCSRWWDAICDTQLLLFPRFCPGLHHKFRHWLWTSLLWHVLPDDGR